MLGARGERGLRVPGHLVRGREIRWEWGIALVAGGIGDAGSTVGMVSALME